MHDLVSYFLFRNFCHFFNICKKGETKTHFCKHELQRTVIYNVIRMRLKYFTGYTAPANTLMKLQVQ
jgi:hypothetical protein